MRAKWLNLYIIVRPGDLNCNLFGVNECSSFPDLQTKTRNLLHIFYVFNMQNVIKEATRILPSTETLIDVILLQISRNWLEELEYCRWASQITA